VTALASTREEYGRTLVGLGQRDPNVVVVGGDLNKSTFAHLFAQQFPQRFFDFGPAEQNIMSVAAGLASSGKTVFVNTFAVFATGRPFDQVRISIAQPHLNVKIVATHAGITTGEDGISAQGIEDLALMCSLPGLTVVVPADAAEARAAVTMAAQTPGPFYIRLSRPATPVVYQGNCPFQLGRADLLRQGTDATIVACGVMVAVALEAAAALATRGVQCGVLNVSTLSPVDTEALVGAARETGAVVVAEEHLKHGGLGSIVARVLGERCPAPLEQVALSGYAESGSPEALLEKYGLTAAQVIAAVHKAVARKG